MKHNFKKGDKVICLPGFINGERCGDKTGGLGYKEGKVFIIGSISRYDLGGPGDCLFPNDGTNGVYVRAVQLYNEDPQYEIY